MKLKKYLQFIKESIKEKIEEKSLWILTEDQIKEFLQEFKDNGYHIDIEFGFVKTLKIEKVSSRVGRYSERDYFTKTVLESEEVRPSYWINIIKGQKMSNEDLTDTLKFVISIINDIANADSEVFGESYNNYSFGGSLNIDEILIKGGLFIDVEPDDDLSGLEQKYLSIHSKQKDTIRITQLDLKEFYNWSCEEKDGKLFVEIEQSDLADRVVRRGSQYKDMLLKGQEVMWDFYDSSDYTPKVSGMFSYELTEENKKLILKALISELGGLESTINHIGDECDDDIYEKVKGKSEDELIEILLNEKFGWNAFSSISQLSIESEVFNEVKDIIANWSMSAHCDDNWKEIVSDFDSRVRREISDFNKVEREEKRQYTSTNANGEVTKGEYTEFVTYYQFNYSNDWITDFDDDDLRDKKLLDLFEEYIGNIDFELNPRISDYGHVDKGELNSDISGYLKGYLGEKL